MGDLVLKGATSGQITLTPTGVAGTNTLTLPAKTGNIITSADSGTVTGTMLAAATVAQNNLATNIAGNGPAFFAYQSGSNQTISNATYTKVRLDAESYDTASCFDTTTNYRFTPNVAGYYQITGGARLSGTSPTVYVWAIYKNGSMIIGNNVNANVSTYDARSVGGLISMNGTTDYLELYAYISASSGQTIEASATYTFMCGFLARSA